jgi:predicted secreted Zn-dependent protease
MHALVLMAPSCAAPATPELQADHERFIDGLDKDNKVVTGGGLKPATGAVEPNPRRGVCPSWGHFC